MCVDKLSKTQFKQEKAKKVWPVYVKTFDQI